MRFSVKARFTAAIVHTHVFGDELRDKRLLRAEEQANKLSVKMLLPLTLFIFPVVVGVVILPLILKLIAVFAK